MTNSEALIIAIRRMCCGILRCGVSKSTLMVPLMVACIPLMAREGSNSELILAADGKSNYTIYFESSAATLSENTAVIELKTFLKKVTKADFKVTNASKSKFISVGCNKYADKYIGSAAIDKLGGEEFIIRSSPEGNIYIVGGRPRGTLYGVMFFLDNIIGIKWLTYDYTYIPDRPCLSLKALDIHEKPDFKQRCIILCSRHPYPVEDSTWQYRNRIDRTMYQGDWYRNRMAKKRVPELKDKQYGIGKDYAPPTFVHTIPRLVPAKKYFKQHPEWWELINGKRQNNGPNSAMCMSNQALIKETAANAIAMIDKQPDCKYISISEADTIRDYCECPECRKLIKRYQAKSGLLLNFVNQVAAIIHKKYPQIMVTTLAYIHSEKAPRSIKAGKNVLIRLCAWNPVHSVPYNDPVNLTGCKFMANLEQWKKVCPNVGIWDYVTTYFINFIPHPNLHTMIPNLKAYHDAGIRYFLAEADHNEGNYRSGESAARIFLLTRGLWNVNASTDETIKIFTDSYYGKQAAAYVRKYWELIRDTNIRAGYTGMTHGGCSGTLPSLRLPVLLKSWNLLQKAMASVKKTIYKRHVDELLMQLQYVLLNSWKEYEQKAMKLKLQLPGTFDQVYHNFAESTARYKDLRINMKRREQALADLKSAYYRTFEVTASHAYGGRPDQAFDDNLRSSWNGGAFKGWLQIKFAKPRSISSIETVFNWKDKSTTYEIQGSMDGKKWFTLVPKRKNEKTAIIQKLSAYLPVIVANDKFAPCNVRYIRTRIFETIQASGKPNWVVIREQKIK